MSRRGRLAQHFSGGWSAGGRSQETIEELASSSGLLFKSLVPHDPTGEMLRIVDRLAHTRAPRTEDGVWVSADGRRTLLVAANRRGRFRYRRAANRRALDAIRRRVRQADAAETDRALPRRTARLDPD